MKESVNQSDTYKIELTGLSANFFTALMIALVTSIIPMLLNSEDAVFFTSLPFYITVVILFGCVIRFRLWGVVASIFTFFLYGLVLELPLRIFLVNSVVNTIELLLMLYAFNYIKNLKIPNRNRYAKGIFYLSQYNSLLIIIFFFYLTVCVFGLFSSNSNVLYCFFGITFLLTMIKVVIERDIRLFLYTFLIALLPSIISCLLSIWLAKVPEELVVDYFCTWTLSNYVLIQTCGYIVYQLLFSKPSCLYKNNELLIVDASTTAYYIAIVLWNSIIIYLFYLNFFKLVNFIYFFPWALGNVFLGLNLLFSQFNDAENVKNKFDWYEKRAIVVENNTSGIITIISFLLPVSATLLDDIPPILLVLFVTNIFCACLAVGLIWVPATNVKFMAFLKTLKTIFYLFAITFLLISVIMIMFSPKKKHKDGERDSTGKVVYFYSKTLNSERTFICQ